MLPSRTATILKSIVRQYIAQAVPIASQSIVRNGKLGISSATVRNEMAYLEHEGYIYRPHSSAGSIPSDKGYRHYVESLNEVTLPLTEQLMISHLFHQVERQIEEWLSLAATLTAQLVHNVALVTTPKPADSKFKHLELVALQDSLALAVLVLHGAKIKQWLINFDQAVPQHKLILVANRLSAAYAGSTRQQISAQKLRLNDIEKQITEHLLKVMQAEDEREQEEPYLDGWHFMLNRPEFAHGRQPLDLMTLVEQRSLLKSITPEGLEYQKVKVVIGKENKAEAFHNYSLVLSRYGIPGEAAGTVGVIGPTRMPYAETIATVQYLSSVLSELIARLYGREEPSRHPVGKEP